MRHSMAWPRGCSVPAGTRNGWPMATRSRSREETRRDLDLEVARALETLFEVPLAGPDRFERFARRRLESRLELGLFPYQAHALAAAPRRRLEEHRVAEPGRLGSGLHVVGERTRGAGDDRHARLLHAA